MKGKRIWPMVLVALALVGILTGCGCTANDARPNNGTVSNPGSNGTVNTDGNGAVSTGPDDTVKDPAHNDNAVPDNTVKDPAHNDVVTDNNGNGTVGNVVDDTIDGAENVVGDAADMVGDAARGVGRAVNDMMGNGTTARNHGRVAN